MKVYRPEWNPRAERFHLARATSRRAFRRRQASDCDGFGEQGTMHILALLYFFDLATILVLGVKSSYLTWSRALIAIYLLLWAVLILTAQILSLFSAINATNAYVILSFIVAVGIAVGLRQIPLRAPPKASHFAEPFSPETTKHITWFLTGTFLLVFVADLVLAYGMPPANPDSISYRFPRVYWYFGQGSLMHFTNASEPRPLYYPFNGTLAYLPFLHFQLGPRIFTAPSLLAWLLTGLTTYVFARDFGGTRLMAAATAWLIVLTPNVLIQSLSTNDEIIAAAPMLSGLFFHAPLVSATATLRRFARHYWRYYKRWDETACLLLLAAVDRNCRRSSGAFQGGFL